MKHTEFVITEDMWVPEGEGCEGFSYSLSQTQTEMVRGPDGLPVTGFLRLPGVLAVIPVSRSTWYAGIKKGIYPKPSKMLGPRIALWDVDDIRSLIKKGSQG